MNRRQRIIGSIKFTVATTITVLITTALGGAGQDLFDWLLKPSPNEADSIGGAMISLPVFMVLGFLWVYWVYPRINRLISADAEVRIGDQIEPKRFLITGYSPIKPTGPTPMEAPEQADLEKITSVDDACGGEQKIRNILGPWQQNIRAVHALRSVASSQMTLKTVYVLNPSSDQFDAFKDTLLHFWPDLKVELITKKQGAAPFHVVHGANRGDPDYEDFDYVFEGINRAVDMIKASQSSRCLPLRYLKDDIAIDLTPGTKTWSAAALTASLNSRLTALYVSTVPPHGVKSYDVTIHLFSHGG